MIEKASGKLTLQQKSPPKDKHLGNTPFKMTRIILKMDDGRTSTNESESKKADNDAEGLIMKNTCVHQDYIKKSKERRITAVNNSTDNIRTNRTTNKTRKRNEKKNNCMDISSDKLVKSNARRPGHGQEIETMRITKSI